MSNAIGVQNEKFEELIYREILEGEEECVCNLVHECFDEFVAHDQSDEGNLEFRKYANTEKLKERIAKGGFVFLAVDKNDIVGMIEIRDYYHICLLFVKNEFQRRGIARNLLNLAIEKCRRENKKFEFIDVNSSPYAVKIYERLGFSIIGEENTVNGIKFTPLEIRF